MTKEKTTYRVLGMMSGTSLDGLDLALCTFHIKNGNYTYSIEKALTRPYPKEVRGMLQKAYSDGGRELVKLHLEYGRYLGDCARDFLQNQRVDFIASHGHTVFHQPLDGYTFQLGSGRALAQAANCTVICDFRTADVLKGGEGAPLVPIGDKLLFPEYAACMNLGGYSNISIKRGTSQPAFDIMPFNVILNRLAQRAGKPYDTGGNLAKSGSCISNLYKDLESPDMQPQAGQKSLGTEWIVQFYLPILREYENNHLPADLLNTVTQFAAFKTGEVLDREVGTGRVLVTGGGAKNTFFIELLSAKTAASIHVPTNPLTDFKEALIFAFLGVLRHRGENNVLSEATGAGESHCAGEIYDIC